MRGKGVQHITVFVKPRITPAYAGKRQMGKMVVDAKRDHPRLCGEKHMEVYAICDITGSPPPMRGKVKYLRHMQSVCWDHPRLCGEKYSR